MLFELTLLNDLLHTQGLFLFIFIFYEQEFYSQDKTELQTRYKSLILNDNLKTGRAEANIKRPKNIVQKWPLS